LACLSLVIIAAAMIYGYEQTTYAVTLRVDDQVAFVRTHQRTVGALLREHGVALGPQDLIAPAEDNALEPGMTITIRRPRQVWIEADGRAFAHLTHRNTVGDVLREAGIELPAGDRVLVESQPASAGTVLSSSRTPSSRGGPSRADAATRQLVRLRVERALPFIVHDSGAQIEMRTAAKSVGEALWDAGIAVFLGDTVTPDLDQPLTAGMHVHIYRSLPIAIVTDGRVIKTRTQGATVADALRQEGIQLGGKDYCEPSLSTLLRADLQIRVVRVTEEWRIDSETLPYETRWEADPNLEIDHQRIAQRGQEGSRKWLYRVTYEDGKAISQTLEREWVAQEPQTHILVYGTKIVLREIQTPDGVKRYWRHLRVLASSYTAATSGKDPGHPAYGITRLGWRATKGIIAVDPAVIPLRANMYVPGYGVGVAGDTGGAIRGRRIDLCYDEHNLAFWWEWVDVYLLEPVPPASQIAWTLPNWPIER